MSEGWALVLGFLMIFFVTFMLMHTMGGGRTEVHVWCDTKGATINYKVSKDKKTTTVWCLKNGVRVP